MAWRKQALIKVWLEGDGFIKVKLRLIGAWVSFVSERALGNQLGCDGLPKRCGLGEHIGFGQIHGALVFGLNQGGAFEGGVTPCCVYV